MEFRQVIEKRRTTRQFTSVPVGRKTIERIIKAGLMAPSFDHARKWNFVILDDAEAKTAAIYQRWFGYFQICLQRRNSFK